MEEYSNISKFLATRSVLIEENINALTTFLAQQQNVGMEYLEQKKSQKEMTFNIFTIASDFYYRENFHSDVICAFLDTKGKHGEGSIFLDVLINLLNRDYHRNISKLNYLRAEAVREYSRIDILVRSVDTKHCIIIENKIYNAGDMVRQLPRYYNKMTEEGYTIDAIVYLPLDKSKSPDTKGWTDEDKKHINPLFCILPAYTQDGKTNLVDGWILPCSLLTNNINCIAALRQYSDLVKQLNNNIMNSVILEKFYNSLMENENNLNSAKAVNEMIANLPIYMADRLVEKFKNHNSHFEVWKWKPIFCGFIFHINGSMYKIDVWPTINGYDVYVFEQTDTGGMDCLEGKIILKDFSLDQYNHNYRHFGFNEENTLIDWIKQSIDEILPLCD